MVWGRLVVFWWCWGHLKGGDGGILGVLGAFLGLF